MGLDIATPPTKIGAPKIHHRTYQICSGNVAERSHCPLQGQGIPKQNLFCSQERDHKAQSYSGYVNPQQSHTMPILSHDHYPPGSPELNTQCLANIHRPLRSLLAHPRSEVAPEVSDVCYRGGKLRLCGDAIWAKHCSQGVYKNVLHHHFCTKGEGCNALWLPRRLARDCPHGASLSKSHTGNLGDVGEGRLSSKLSKVLAQPSTVHRVAGLGVEDSGADPVSPSSQSPVPQSLSLVVHKPANVLQEAPRKNSGSDQLGQQCGSLRQDPPKICQRIPTRVGEASLPGSAPPHGSGAQTPTEILDPFSSTGLEGASCYASVNLYHHDRRFFKGLGLPHFQGDGRQWSVEPIHERQAYKHFRIHGFVDSPKENQITKGNVDSCPVRQHDGSELFKERGFSQVIPTKPNDPFSNFVNDPKRLVLDTDSRQGSVQCQGGPSVEGTCCIDRMGDQSGFTSVVVTADVHRAASGSVCDSTEPQISDLCVPDHDEGSFCSGRSQGELESVEGGVPFSPLSTDFSSFRSPRSLSRESNSPSPQMAQTTVVPPSSPNGPLFNQLTPSSSITSGQWTEALSTLLRDFHSTRMDFLKVVYRRSSTPLVVDYLTSALRKSTYKQYESIWEKIQGLFQKH